LSLDNNGLLSGIPTESKDADFSVTLQDAKAYTVSSKFRMRVRPAPLSITTPAQLPNGVVNNAYNTTLAARGGVTPYKWLVTAGSLPAGLSLDQASGAITGTPSTAGNVSFTVTVQDARSSTSSSQLSLQVYPPGLVVSTPSQLADGVVGNAYSVTVAASGGTPPYQWQVTGGSLPPGLGLDASSGVISGTPSAVGNANFTLTVSDANATSASSGFSIRVFPPALSITSGSQLPNGSVGAAYNTTLTATGGVTPYRWQVSSGALPSGLSLNQTTGAITGTPATATTSNVTISVTDANSSSTSSAFSLRVAPAPLAITTASPLPNGTVGTAYSTTLNATGGTTPYRWRVTSGSLPAGLSLDQVSGVISGTPTSAITASVTVTVSDANATNSGSSFSLRVNPAPLAIATGFQLPSGTVGTSYSTTLAATGGTTPYRWQVNSGALPAGLSLNQTTGVISGTPTSPGTSSPNITVTDANNSSVSAGFSLQVMAAPLAITTGSQLPGGTVNAAYSTSLGATGGTTPYRWQVTGGALPAGLSLNQTSGIISGTPSVAGTSTPTISVTDANLAVTSSSFTLPVTSSVTDPNGWTLVWSDEFSGPNIDRNVWGNEVGFVRNNELQKYTTDAANQYIENGELVIKANYVGGSGQGAYTSASLTTRNKKSFMYGKIQARIKTPSPTGSWPAFWLLPVRGGWPQNGEIDVLESVSQNPNTVFGSVHYASGGVHASLMNMNNLPAPLSTDYHIYEIVWSPSAIDWYIDGSQYGHFDTGGADNSAFTGYPFYIILNYAIGGAWAEAPNSSQYPGEMRVDWVRQWQHP
jgi:beta-glucanase (GH16 family)